MTDVGGCTELIKEGVNGYVVPLDMNFNVNKLLKIPKCNEYDNHALEKWLDYLGDAVYIEKEEEKVMKFIVTATDKYEKTNTSDSERAEAIGVKRYVPKEGEKWEVTATRKDILVKNGFVTCEEPIVEVAVKEPKKEKAVKKTTKKTTTKKSK